MKMKKILMIAASAASFSVLCACNDSDQTFLDKINKDVRDSLTPINSCYDAILAVEGAGDQINEHELKDNKEFVFDIKAKQFVIMDGDKIVRTPKGYKASDSTYDYFKSVFKYDPNSRYSQYLDKRAEVPTSLLLTTGFDIGAHKDITQIVYTNVSGVARDVMIRTYSDSFSIQAPLDTVHHYDTATNITIEDVGYLDAHGVSAYMNAKNGKVGFASKSSTDIVEVTSAQGQKVTFEKADDASILGVINGDVSGAAKLTPTIVNDHDSFVGAINNPNSLFIRFGSDITLNKESIALSGQFKCLDLNGSKLVCNGHENDMIHNIHHGAIEVNDGANAFIMDTQGIIDPNSGIELNDSSILIYTSNPTSKSSLTINSGKITQNIKEVNKCPAIQCIGVEGDDPQNPYTASLTMYGGTITSRLADDYNPTKADVTSCAYAHGAGALFDIAYGNVVSDYYCFATGGNNVSAISNNGRPTVNINGGNFTSDKGAAIYCPGKNDTNDEYHGVNLTIDGAKITGPTCVFAKEGAINIDNAILNANGKYYAAAPNIEADGSVLDFNTINSDGAKLEVNVADSMLYSKFAYITSAYNSTAEDNSSIKVNLKPGISYSYYLGEGLSNKPTKGNVEFNVTADPNTWIKHSI